MRKPLLALIVAALTAGAAASPAEATTKYWRVKADNKPSGRVLGVVTYDFDSYRLCGRVRSNNGPKGYLTMHVESRDGNDVRQHWVDRRGGGATCITFYGSERDRPMRIHATGLGRDTGSIGELFQS